MFNRFKAALALTWFLVCPVRAEDSLTNYAAEKPGDPGFVAEDPRLAQLVGKAAPSIELKSMSGKPIDIVKSYGSRPVYLKVWATYCLPCRAQMPAFEKIFQDYGKKMQIVAVNAGIGDEPAKVRKFVAKLKIHMPVAIDDGTLIEWLQLDATPFHLLIDKDGRIAYAGHQDGPRLNEALKRVLSDPTDRAAETASPLGALKPGDTVPALQLTGSDNSPVEIAPTGRPRVVLFTASWCESYLKDTEPKTAAACRRAREQADMLSGDPSIDWLAVVTQLWTTPRALAAYQAQMKTRVPMAVDKAGESFRRFAVHAFPAAALIDGRGRLLRMVDLQEHDLAAAVKELAGK